MNGNEKYNDFRHRYPVMEYCGYEWLECEEGLRLRFDLRMGDIEFHPTALVERRRFLNFDIDKRLMDGLVFDIGMIELISYWKCACPPTVKVTCGSLTEEQVAFWKKLYWNGLGEFYYTNGIEETPEAFLEVGSGECVVGSGAAALEVLPAIPYALPTDYLVPVGGGKDSVVTLELLRRAGKKIRPLIMNPRGATVECARVAGFPMDEVLVIRRTIDPTLLELNANGYLNGHTPFSAMLAFYTRLASALSGIPNVALSNENSANESTVKGSYVNHQYSKSLEFEDDFRRYTVGSGECVVDSTRVPMLPTNNYPLPTYNYFSFLRPLSELQIAMLFSRFTAYHDVFRSCNVGSKQDIWCGHCAKCLFAYIILSPFIDPARLSQIFGKPMLDDLTLEHEFKQLVGEAETKPFECVGTVREVRQALTMAIERWYPKQLPALLKDWPKWPMSPKGSISLISPIGNLTPEERQILQAACTEKNN